MADSWGDIHTWLGDVGEDRVFRLYHQTIDTYKFVTIKELIELPDGDCLIGFQDTNLKCEYLEYFKLSEIKLEYCPEDKEKFYDEFDQ